MLQQQTHCQLYKVILITQMIKSKSTQQKPTPPYLHLEPQIDICWDFFDNNWSIPFLPMLSGLGKERMSCVYMGEDARKIHMDVEKAPYKRMHG